MARTREQQFPRRRTDGDVIKVDGATMGFAVAIADKAAELSAEAGRPMSPARKGALILDVCFIAYGALRPTEGETT